MENLKKEAAAKYLQEELDFRLQNLSGKPDALCQAYQVAICSLHPDSNHDDDAKIDENQMKVDEWHQYCQEKLDALIHQERDVIQEVDDFLGQEKIGFETLVRSFIFFSDFNNEERRIILDKYRNGEFAGH